MRVIAIQPFLKSPAVDPSPGPSARNAALLSEELVRRGCVVEIFPSPEAIGTESRWAVAPGTSARVWPTMELPVAGDLRLLLSAVPRLRPLPRSARQMVFAWMELVAMRRALAHGMPDIVHDHLGMMRLTRMMRALGARVPMVLTHPEGQVEADLAAYAAVVFPSRMAQARSAAKVQNARIIPPPVSPVFLAGEVATAPSPNLLLFVGGPHASGGLELLLQAMRAEDRLRRTCRVTVCGDVPEGERMRREINKEGLPVRMAGIITTSGLREILDQTALLVLPGHPAAGSRALREAACRGVPAVTWSRQADDLSEVLDMPAAIGLAVGECEPRVLAGHIFSALEGAMVSLSFRAGLARRAREVFSPAGYAERYLRLYGEVS
jgi:glycosyltransferase involved in cell wall biosynthesis